MALTNRRRFPVLLILIAALALFLAGAPARAQEGSAPDAPTGLIVASVSHDSIELDWDDSGDSSITHYQVFRRDRAVHEAGEFVTIEEDTGSTATEYTDATVEADKEYVYRVKAVNAHGASPWSDQVRADTPTGPGQGAVYTYEDGDRTIRVILQGDLVVQETGANTPSDGAVRRTAGGNAPYVRRPANDIDTLDAAGNHLPYSIWSDGTTMWVADWNDDKLYAYTLATGARDTSKEFDLHLVNDDPIGIWSDGVTMWVADWGINRIFAYMLATGAQDTSKTVDLHFANANPAGIWSDGITMWVADDSDDKLYAYTLATGARDSDKDIDTLAVENDVAFGIWSDGATMWVADWDTKKLFAYALTTGARDASRDFTTLDAAENDKPAGIWSDGAIMWVADTDDSKLYAYNMPDSKNANLSTLTMDSESVAGFDPYRIAYQFGVAAPVAGATVQGVAQDPNSALRYSPDDADGSTPGHQVHLSEGQDWKNVYVVVTAEDGITSRSYTVTIQRGSDAPYGWRAADDLYALASGNDRPEGIWSDGITMWVLDGVDRKLYAYTLATGARDTSKEFNVYSVKVPVGIWSDGITMWVSYRGTQKLHAYALATGARDTSKEFNLDPSNDPFGIWSDGTTMWVAAPHDYKLYAYTLATGDRDASKEFTASGAYIWSDGTTMWTTGTGGLSAYTLATGARDANKDFPSLHYLNRFRYGIWSDGITMWVAGDGRVYSYNMPGPSNLSALTVDGESVAALDPDRTSYQFGVAASVARVTVQGVAQHADSALDYSPDDADGSTPGHQVYLSEGRNVVTVTVTAKDGITTRDYTVSVNQGSDAAYGWRAADDIDTLAAAGNTGAGGIWSDNITMWVADWALKRIFAYMLATGARDTSKEFDLDPSNNPAGISSDGITMWVADDSDDKLYAYTLVTGARDSGKDIDTLAAAENNWPDQIWSDGTTMWVADQSDRKLYAYMLATGARDASRDFDTLVAAGNTGPAGIWSDGITMWVADWGDYKLYAYTLATGARDASRDFDTLVAAGAFNAGLRGIWSDGTTMWVADYYDDKLYAYNMPPPNSPPEFADDTAMRSVAENSVPGTNVGTAVTATDDDDDTLTYTLEGTDAASFTIVSTSGQLRTKSGVTYNHEATKNSYSVTVSVSDGKGGSDTITVTITVTDVNEPPDAPGAPTVTAVSGATTSLSVRWTAPANTGPPINSYGVQYRKSGDAAWSEKSHSGTGRTATITGLTENTSYQVQVLARNAEGASGWSATGSGRTAANSAPVFVEGSSATRTVAENTAANTDLGAAFTATDADNDALTYTLEGNDAASFALGGPGQLRTKAALDYEDDSRHSVRVRVSDGKGGSDTITVTITVTDVNEPPDEPEAPTVTTITGGRDRLAVSWTAPANAGKPAINDYDVQYRKLGDAAWSEKSHSGTGRTATITGLTENTSYEVQVLARNAEGASGWSATGSGRTAANSAPVFAEGSSATRTVTENTVANTNLGAAFTATDADNDSLTYTLGGTDADSFVIISTSGQLRTKAALDYEDGNRHSVTVRVSDGEGGSDTITVTITVTDVNEPPDAPGAPTVTAVSGITDSLDVGWTAPDNTGPAIDGYDVQYREGTSGAFTPWPHTGTGTTATITGLTENTSYQVQVQATNAEGASGWSATGSGRTGVQGNNPPEFGEGSSAMRSVAENTGAGTNVGTAVTATDGDNDTLTYSLAEELDAASFAIVSTSGQIRTKDALDYETKSSYTVTVRAADGNGGSDTIMVTITVTDVNEPPDAPRAPAVTATSGMTDSLDVIWTAPDTTDRPEIDGYDVQYRKSGDTDWIAQNHFDASVTTTITDLEANTLYQVQVLAMNAEGASDWSASGTGRTEPNSAPEFDDGASLTRSVAENTAANTNLGAAFAATDADDDSLTYSLAGTDKDSFAIDSTFGHIKTKAALDYEGKRSYRVRVEVTDGKNANGAADDRIDDRINVTITVTNVNEAPVVTGEELRSFEENSDSKVATYTADDPERDTITWSVSDDNTFWISRKGELYFRTPPNYEQRRMHTVTVTATEATEDNSGLQSDPLFVTITVTDAEEEGVVTISPPRGWVDVPTAFSVVLRDDDDAISDTTWQWARSPNGRSSWVDIAEATSSYTVTADDANHYLRASVSYKDRRGSNKPAEAVLSTPVGDVRPAANTAPEFPATETGQRSVSAGTAAGRNIGSSVRATDADQGDVLTYSLSGTDAGDFNIDAATGQLRTKAVLDSDTKNSYTVMVSVSDGFDGAYSPSTDADATIEVTITVTEATVVVPQPRRGGGGGGGRSRATPTPTPTPSPTPTPTGPQFSGVIAAEPSVTATVVPEGTTLGLNGGGDQPGGVYVNFPPAAVALPVQVSVSVSYEAPDDVTAPSGTTLLPLTIDIIPETPLTLGEPLTIEINPTPEQLEAAGGDLNHLAVGVVTPNGVVVLPTQVMHGRLVVTIDHLSTFVLLAITDPGPVLRQPPMGDASSMGPLLQWTQPPETTWFQVQVIPFNEDGPGINLVIGDGALVQAAQYQVLGPNFGSADPNYVMLPDMTYLWRVRTSTVLTNPTEADWSAWAGSSFRTPPASSSTITRVAPALYGEVSTLTPTLTWANSNPAVFYYEVQVSRDFEFGPNAFLYSEYVHGGASTPPNSYVVPEAFPLEAGVIYYWRVRPRIQGDGDPLPWSRINVFQTPG